MAVEISKIASPGVDPSALQIALAVVRDDAAEREPEDPAPGPREVAAMLIATDPERTVIAYVASLDGEPAGLAIGVTCSAPDDELQLVDVEVMVRPALRRAGIGSGLMAELVPDLMALGQNSMIAYSLADLWAEAGAGFCQRYGLTRRQDERCSRVQTVDVPEELLANWLADAAIKAPGYSMAQWIGPCPDPLIEQWCAAADAMEDAPLDGVEFNHVSTKPDTLRMADQARLGQGWQQFRSLVLSPDGEPAGISEINVHLERPQLGHQTDTGVVKAHRGRGLGRWLKAANYRHVRNGFPELRTIQTYNAESNPWMLDINVAMGFRPYHTYVAHQGPMADVVAGIRAS